MAEDVLVGPMVALAFIRTTDPGATVKPGVVTSEVLFPEDSMLGLPKTTRPLNVPEPADTSLRAIGDVVTILGVPYPFHSTNWA